MTPSTFLLILTSVAMSAIAQILLKTGMSRPSIAALLESGRRTDAALAIATNLWVVGGLSLYFLSALVWLMVLSRVQVSFAYPFVAMGFVLTMVLGWLVMGDTVGTQRIAGTLLISLGVVLIARGG